jgi:hypothetical protein
VNTNSSRGEMNLEEKVACELKDLALSSQSGRNARRGDQKVAENHAQET